MKRTLIAVLFVFAVSIHAEISHLVRIDDHIWRGRQPHAVDFAEVKKMGIKTVLDLRGGPIHKPHEEKIVTNLGMQYISIRLSGIWEPHDEQMGRVLGVLEDPNRWPIFIHCRRGDDRLGMVVACYRISHDHWTNQQAFDEATHEGLSIFEQLMRRYIMHFDPAKAQPTADPTASAGASSK